MFECPSYIQVDGKDVLFLSLMGREPEGDRYHNEFSSLYFIGELDLENMKFHVESYDEIDKGFDFYAPQAFYGENKQPMMFAWFGCGVQDLPYAKDDMWIHALTMPRILSIKNGKLYQEIPEEISSQFENRETSENSWRLHLDMTKESYSDVQIGEDGDCLNIHIDIANGYITADRTNLLKKISEEYGSIRRLQVQEGTISSLDLYYDNTFLEIYINGGEEVMTLRAFPEKNKIVLKK